MTAEADPVKIDELEIVRAPGFKKNGFEVKDLSSGINLIHGPNAAGKTTTADSITQIFWPSAADNGEHLICQMSLNGEQWRVEVDNGSVEYQRDGQEAGSPNFPTEDHQDRYKLSLHDLLQQETRNENFAETVARESAGGYDLSAAYDTLNYSESATTRRNNVYQDAKTAVETWRDERKEAKGLEEERSRLTKLRNELEEAKYAREEKEALDQAITHCNAQAELEQAKSELDGLPDVLENVNGNEHQQVEKLDKRIQEWKEKKAAAGVQKQEAEGTLKRVALSEKKITDETITELKQRRDTLENLESQRDTLKGALESTKARLENVRQDIPLDVEHDDLVALEPGTWADVSGFAQNVYQLQAQQRLQQSVIRWAEKTDAVTADRRALERGSAALENWLLTGQESPKNGSESAYRMGIVSGGLVSLAGLALGAFVNPVLYSVVLVGIGLFVYGYRQHQRTETGNERAQYRSSFEQTELESPESWTKEAVRERLAEVYTNLADDKIDEERKHHRDALLDEQNLAEQGESLEEQREELRETLGAMPDTTDLELSVIVRRVLDWQAVHDEVVGLRKKLNWTETTREQTQKILDEKLGGYGYNDIEDSASGTGAIRELEQRKTQCETAKRDLDDAECTIEDAEEKVVDLEDERESIFTAINLEPSSRDELQSLCERVETYDDALSRVERKKAVVEQERQRLEKLPGYNSSLKAREFANLKQALQEAEDTATRYDEIQERIAEIEAKINKAKSDTTVEEAITEKQRALDALKEQLDEDYSSMIGGLLVDHIQDITIEASRPVVFQRANELLATITHGRYKLDLDESKQTFRAYDTAEQKGLALDELSSGTRVQILLSVRLAFVGYQENSAKLPIVLDETLANTDDIRAVVIIESLIELAKEGRQIFYFTAQGDEVAKWHTALNEEPAIEWTMINLAELRDLDKTAPVPEFGTIKRLTPNPPEPSDHDHCSYAKALEVKPINPYEKIGTVHLWYLVEDVDVLHELLKMGVDKWGPLENLLDLERHNFIPADAGMVASIQQNAEALDEFVQSWRIGRGDPVDREVLEVSGAVSDTFIDRVTDLTEELNGDGEQLVEALRDGAVERFWGGKTAELEEYLRENGYIASTDPIADDEIRIRMIDRLVAFGVPRGQAFERTNALLARITQEQA